MSATAPAARAAPAARLLRVEILEVGVGDCSEGRMLLACATARLHHVCCTTSAAPRLRGCVAACGRARLRLLRLLRVLRGLCLRKGTDS